MSRGFRWLGSIASISLLMSGAIFAAETYHVDIPPQPMTEALQRFAEQSGLQVVYYAKIAEGRMANGVEGTLSVKEALGKMLANTGLTFQEVDARTVAIRVMGKEEGDRPAASAGAAGDAVRVAQVEGEEVQADEEERGDSEGDLDAVKLDEVVVTGTHIRGTEQPVGAQLITIGEEEIRKSGFSIVQDVVRSLPQNFTGDVRSDLFFSGEGSTNSANDTAPNLRGLGARSTLVLLNGRRLAPGGSEAAFSGTSSIPITAIERIEVLPDGASALYGSDAIGGVINMITRKDYEGLETTARYGTVTQGALDEVQLGQSIGQRWDRGNGVVSLEYHRRGAFPAADRPQTRSDLTRHGGNNFDTNLCNPGTILSGGTAYAIPKGQNGVNLSSAQLVSGTQNFCDRYEGADLVGEESRRSVVSTAQHELSDRVQLFADLTFSDRESKSISGTHRTALIVPSTNAFYVNPSGGTDPVVVFYNMGDDTGPTVANIDTRTWNAAVGFTFEASHDWSLTTYVAHARERHDQIITGLIDSALLNAALADSNPATAFNPFGDGSHTSPSTLTNLRDSQRTTFSADSRLLLANATADGSIFALPGGVAKLALGVDYRKQLFKSANVFTVRSSAAPSFARYQNFDRHVDATSMELFLPIIGDENRQAWLRRLDMSLAGRYESYSDFGSAAVPRAGLRWSPTSALTVRGTWSKSYRAPNIADVDANNMFSTILAMPDNSAPLGQSNVLVLGGRNPDLTEERATIWTAGFDMAPERLAGLQLGVTFFDIDFIDRISALPSFDLNDPVNAPALTRQPTVEQRVAACETGEFFGNFSTAVGNCETAAVDAIFDTRLRNIAAVEEQGLDLQGSYTIPLSIGQLTLSLNATYLLQYDLAVTETAPLKGLTNTPGNPVDLKMRGSINWSHAGFATTVYVNYVDNYTDNISVPARPISSWTTVDLGLSYSPESLWSVFENLSIALNAQNVLDADPPFYNNTVGIGFDPANSNVTGRFISLTARKNW